MLNKYLRQNWKLFAKFKVRPLGSLEEEYPKTMEEANDKSREIWEHLWNDEIKRESFHCVKGKKGYNLSVVSDDKYCYLIQCVRTEYNIDEITIFINDLTDKNIDDFKSIAKMIRYHIKNIIGYSKEGVQELNKLVKAQEIQKEIEGKPVDA